MLFAPEKELIKEVLERYAKREVNLSAEVARDMLAEAIVDRLNHGEKMEEMRRYPHQDNHMD